MDKKISLIKERVLQIAENEKVGKERFFKELDFSYANFKGPQKKTALNSNYLAKILFKYPTISAEWLITGEGEMLKEENASGHDIEMLLKENNKLKGEVSTLQSKLIACLESRVYPQDNKQTKAS